MPTGITDSTDNANDIAFAEPDVGSKRIFHLHGALEKCRIIKYQ